MSALCQRKVNTVFTKIVLKHTKAVIRRAEDMRPDYSLLICGLWASLNTYCTNMGIISMAMNLQAVTKFIR